MTKLIDRLVSDSHEEKMHSIHQLPKIASALGKQKVFNDLIPFLENMVDEEDEVVSEILKQIQLVVDFKIDFKYTMNFLLKCSEIFNEDIQETIAKIYSGIGKLDQSILLSPVKEHFFPSPFYLQRILASKLIPKLYKTYPECAEIYKTLCED